MWNKMIIASIVGGLALLGGALPPQMALAQATSATCPDGAEVSLPVKVRHLHIGDCVVVGLPPGFSSLIVTSQSVNPPVSTLFYSDEKRQMQRFDTQFAMDGFIPVPETGLTLINDFGHGLRYQINYTGPSPICTTTVLNGSFIPPSIPGPAQFQGVLRILGHPVAIFRAVTGDTVIESYMRVKSGIVLRQPVRILRRSPVFVSVEQYFNFHSRSRPRNFTPPDFCPDTPPDPKAGLLDLRAKLPRRVGDTPLPPWRRQVGMGEITDAAIAASIPRLYPLPLQRPGRACSVGPGNAFSLGRGAAGVHAAGADDRVRPQRQEEA